MKKEIWIIINMLLTTIIGLFNTVLIRPDEVGSWKNYLGFIFLGIAAIHLLWFLVIFYKKKLKKNT